MKFKKIIESYSFNSNNLLMENRNCPICKEDNTRHLLKLSGFQFFSDAKEASKTKQVDLNEVHCQSCGANYLNPCYTPKGFEQLFSEAGQSYGSTEIRPIEQVEWLEKRELLVKGNRIFDIGCGTGNFLAALPNHVQKGGVDIDAQSIDMARSKYPEIDFVCSSFESFEYKKNVDVFTMFHVLEHLANPQETLRRIHNLSTESTYLIIEVPILENGLTNDINGFFSVQHLTHFSRNSLKNILQLTGWRQLEWVEQPDYNGCRVLSIKSNPVNVLSYSQEELLNTWRYLKNWYQSIGGVEEKISKISSGKYIIWGAGLHLEFLYHTTSLFSLNFNRSFILVDRDPIKQGTTWRGIEIHNPSVIKTINDYNGIIVSSYGGQEKICSSLEEMNISSNVIKLYDSIRVY